MPNKLGIYITHPLIQQPALVAAGPAERPELSFEWCSVLPNLQMSCVFVCVVLVIPCFTL